MIRITLVEDEKEHMDILLKYLKRYEEEHHTFFQITTFSDGLDIISEYKAEHDIILLDIQMKHLDGMTAAEKIRALDEDVIFIFITSTVQFAVQGYLVDALGYILKPVPYLAFSQILHKAIKKVEQKQSKLYLTIETEGGQLRLDTASIYYIESQKHNVIIHSEKGNYRTAGPLKHLEELLSDKGFSKAHNAYLINLQHVAAVMPNLLRLNNKEELPISRARKKVFMDALTDYMGGIQR